LLNVMYVSLLSAPADLGFRFLDFFSMKSRTDPLDLNISQ